MNQKELKRISRLIALIDKCASLKCIKPAMLAQDFGVSKRTIYRDLRVLEEAGIPLVIDEATGLYIKKGYKFPITLLAKEEVQALHLSRVLMALHTEYEIVKHFNEAVNKIKQALPDVMRRDIDSVSHGDAQ
jgi:predicted DNA-binding transcriptional regulator YafY